MPISIAQLSNKKKIKNGGFSLIEILIVLFLITLIYFIIPNPFSNSESKSLTDAVDLMDRAVRFASQESVLRNSVVRLKINLDKFPHEYVVEYGPKEGLILPEFTESTTVTLEEEENQKKVNKTIDQQFTKVPEMNDIEKPFDENVKILGIATSLRNKLILKGEVSLFFYPTGERDSALIILSTSIESVTLDIRPYSDKIDVLFKPIDLANTNRDIEEFKEKLAQTYYQDWIKKD